MYFHEILLARRNTTLLHSVRSLYTVPVSSWPNVFSCSFNTTAIVPAYSPSVLEDIPSMANEKSNIIEALGFGNIYDTSYSTLINFPLGAMIHSSNECSAQTVADRSSDLSSHRFDECHVGSCIIPTRSWKSV
jgi:hypothetical protein